jgi:uncharacterized protein YjiS (DUF1127 family)
MMSKLSEPLGGGLSVTAGETAQPTGWLARLLALPVATLEWLLLCQERWRQYQALQALDDRMLRDIGLDRGQVEREIRKRPWQVGFPTV